MPTLEQLETQEDATLEEIISAFEQVMEHGGSFSSTKVNQMLIRATKVHQCAGEELRAYKHRFLTACRKGIVNCNQPGAVNETATLGLLSLIRSVQL
jgi:hypothetical protein